MPYNGKNLGAGATTAVGLLANTSGSNGATATATRTPPDAPPLAESLGTDARDIRSQTRSAGGQRAGGGRTR